METEVLENWGNNMTLETNFGLVASLYSTYRLTFPQLLFEKILGTLSPPYNNALDLGAGTGLSTLPDGIILFQ